MDTRILIVEDDPSLTEIMTDFFRHNGFDTVPAHTGNEALSAVSKQTYDLILLDINLPDISGFEVCREIRRTVSEDVPILFITARASEADKLNGYALGGDDYITKPFSLPVLLAKIRNLLKRISPRETILYAGEIAVDRDSHEVRADGHTETLPQKDFELLVFLAENSGKLLTREQLLIRIWGYDFDGTDRVVDDHIRRLRATFPVLREYIRTVHGYGYRFTVPEERDGV